MALGWRRAISSLDLALASSSARFHLNNVRAFVFDEPIDGHADTTLAKPYRRQRAFRDEPVRRRCWQIKVLRDLSHG